MVDLSAVSYRVVAIDETGKRHNISGYVQNLGWEENRNEISVRSSFAARNDRASEGYLAGIIKPGCLICIYASDGATFDEEVARGYVERWNLEERNSGDSLRCTCYDELYKLQKSQDNRYYPSGTGTKSALQGIFDDWGIPQGEYRGPDATHGKMVHNNRYLSDIVLWILDDAAKKGEKRCIVRAEKGRTSIMPRGGNRAVYVFREDNTQSFSHSVSTENLITRVKVVGQADDAGKRSVDATVNGRTEYGIRQRIYIRGSDESLGDANAAAQEILGGEGKVEKGMTVQAPDVPFIHKGDRVYVVSGSVSGYYCVDGIQHDADSFSMTMELGHMGEEKEGYKAGDIVDFFGGTHYVSSYPGAKGYSAGPGRARITHTDGAGKAHPWHLIHEDGGSNVYGWVDDGTFS